MKNDRHEKIIDSLKNWTTFNAKLKEWSIEELKTMLAHESTHSNRATFIKRIKQRTAQMYKEQMTEELK